MKNLIYIFCFSILLTSCFKKEDPRDKNTMASVSLKLGEDYGNVFYYNLANQTIVKQNYWTEWDLAFYAQEDNNYIKLNNASNMKAYNLETTQFDDIIEFNENWISKVDDPTGNINNLALKFNVSHTKDDTTFYEDNLNVLLLGTDATGQIMGYKKVSLLYTYSNQYALRHSNLDNTEDYVSIINKDVTLNYVHFTFLNKGNVVEIEPDKTTWDIMFTRSTDMTITNDYVDTVFDYSVTSVLLNQTFTEAFLETELKFEEIKKSHTLNNFFIDQLNIIGYNWKAFDLTNSTYAVREENTYLLKDINDFYYKLRFLSFYDPETNIKGTITFEYEILN